MKHIIFVLSLLACIDAAASPCERELTRGYKDCAGLEGQIGREICRERVVGRFERCVAAETEVYRAPRPAPDYSEARRREQARQRAVMGQALLNVAPMFTPKRSPSDGFHSYFLPGQHKPLTCSTMGTSTICR